MQQERLVNHTSSGMRHHHHSSSAPTMVSSSRNYSPGSKRELVETDDNLDMESSAVCRSSPAVDASSSSPISYAINQRQQLTSSNGRHYSNGGGMSKMARQVSTPENSTPENLSTNNRSSRQIQVQSPSRIFNANNIQQQQQQQQTQLDATTAALLTALQQQQQQPQLQNQMNQIQALMASLVHQRQQQQQPIQQTETIASRLTSEILAKQQKTSIINQNGTIDTHKALFTIVKWARSIAAFNRLPVADQTALVMNSWRQQLALNSAEQHSISSAAGAGSAENQQFQLFSSLLSTSPPHSSPSLSPINSNNQQQQQHISKHVPQAAQKLIEMKADVAEIAFLKAISLFSSDSPGLSISSIPSVEQIQSEAMSLLAEYAVTKTTPLLGHLRFGRLLLALSKSSVGDSENIKNEMNNNDCNSNAPNSSNVGSPVEPINNDDVDGDDERPQSHIDIETGNDELEDSNNREEDQSKVGEKNSFAAMVTQMLLGGADDEVDQQVDIKSEAK